MKLTSEQLNAHIDLFDRDYPGILNAGAKRIIHELYTNCPSSTDFPSQAALGPNWESCYERVIRAAEMSNDDVYIDRATMFIAAGFDVGGLKCCTSIHDGSDNTTVGKIIVMLDTLFVE